MKAIALNGYGGPEALRLTDLPDPKVAPGEVLIRVRAAGVNPVDWKLAGGRLDAVMETHFPLVPGWDVAGVVERVGFDVEEFAPGDEVFGYIRKDTVQFGAYAELVSAHVRMVARKPAALSWEQAAGVPLAGLTAYQAIKRVGVRAGETVLVHAAAGGVGSFGVQIAVAFGARVIGTATDHNHDFVRKLGAEPVAYGPGLDDRVARLAPKGIDAALDFVGADAVDTSLRLLGRPDRLASITAPEAAAQGGHYVWVRPNSADLAALADLADTGKLAVHVERVLPLAEAAEAWRLNACGQVPRSPARRDGRCRRRRSSAVGGWGSVAPPPAASLLPRGRSRAREQRGRLGEPGVFRRHQRGCSCPLLAVGACTSTASSRLSRPVSGRR